MVASAFHVAASATALGDAAAAGRFAAAAAATLGASRFAQARMAAIAAGRACGDDADKVRAAGDAAAAAATLAGADEDEAEAAREAGMHIYASHEEEAVPPDAVTAAEEAASRAAASIIIERGVDADSAVTAEATAAVAAAAITSAVAAGAPVSQAAMIAGVAAAKALRSVRRQNDGAVQMTLQQPTSQPEQHVPEEVGFLEAESTMLQSSREEAEQRVQNLRKSGRFREAATVALTVDRLRRREMAMKSAYQRAHAFFSQRELGELHNLAKRRDERSALPMRPEVAPPTEDEIRTIRELAETAAAELAAADRHAAELRAEGKHDEATRAMEAVERLRTTQHYMARALERVERVRQASQSTDVDYDSSNQKKPAESTPRKGSKEVASAAAGWGSPIRSFLDTIAQVRAGVQDAARLEVIISHGLALAHEQALEGSSSMRAATARRTFDEKVEHALSHNASTWETEMDAEQFADSVNRIELAVESLTLALAEEEKLRSLIQ